MIKNLKNKYVYIIILTLVFCLGLAVTPDYGIPPDENTEISILMGNLREYLGLYFKEDSQVMYYFDSQGFIPIRDSVEIDHGQAAYYLISPLIFMAKTGQISMSGEEISLIYHYYTYIISFTAVLAIYILIKDLFKNKRLALICALAFFATPRIFAQMHFNNKDIVFLALMADTCCLGVLATKYCRPAQVIGFSLLAAIAANTKVVGLFAFGVIGLFYIIYVSAKREWGKNRIIAMLTAMGLFFLVYYLITPAMWGNIQGFFDYSLFNAFKFSRWDGTVLFEGEFYHPAAGELPNRYIISLISITTPVYILALAILGLGRLFGRIAASLGNRRVKNADEAEKLLFISMICICTLLPLLIASVKKTIVYNGWRHFYFSYLGIIVLAAYGLELLMERFGRVIPILATTLICLTAIQMGFNHPYQYAYFNVLTEREDRQLYDTDYWGVSTRDALDYILDHDNSNEMVQISWGTDSTRLLLINAYNVMPYERGMKIDLVYDYDDAEYIVVNTTSGVVNGFEKPDGFYLLYSIEAYGNRLTDIYARET